MRLTLNVVMAVILYKILIVNYVKIPSNIFNFTSSRFIPHP